MKSMDDDIGDEGDEDSERERGKPQKSKCKVSIFESQKLKI